MFSALGDSTLHGNAKLGENIIFGYTGGIDIVDREMGNARNTSRCCGVMAMSSYRYGEFTFMQNVTKCVPPREVRHFYKTSKA